METRKKSAISSERSICRQRRKQIRKEYNMGRKKPESLFDSRGYLHGEDLCDCLDRSCVGCHFPCPKCSSEKCGTDCRVNRKYQYQKIEIEGASKSK